jgi:His/Glu/Gln/Arg/opine family amino acid ABC transporter permease subunit
VGDLDIAELTKNLIHLTPYDIWYLIKGAFVTLGLSVGAIGIGSCLGAVVGWIRSFRIVRKNPLLWGLTALYVDVIRGTPLLLQVYIVYYAVPPLTGIETSVFFAGVASLALYQGAYVSEAVRAGLEAIDKTQWWGGLSLGMGYFETLRHVIFPQAVRIMIPPYIGICLGVIKDTSLVSTIGFIELAFSAGIIGRRTLDPLPPWIMAAAIYFVICFPISKFSQRVEARLRRRG